MGKVMNVWSNHGGDPDSTNLMLQMDLQIDARHKE